MSDPLAAPADVAAAPSNADVTSSGLASITLQEGSGSEKPSARDTVEVHYSGWQSSDGNLFDSSVKRGEKISFPLNQVIPGWTEGLQLMVVGEKRRFWIPADLAYGETPSRPGAPSGALVFDVELFDIKKAPEQPAAPADLTAPADAEKSDSGLASKVLESGDGGAKPGPEDVVKAHFSGWTANGEFLESTLLHDGPAQFKLDQVSIKGWVEGLQLMTAGEKRRLWIPADLAFGKEAPQGAPQGDLIFDFELLEFQDAPKKPEPLPAPADVAAAPDDAETTASGLASKVLEKGSGSTHPTASQEVNVHYTGWTTDGEMFDSSVVRGEPISFPLNGVIPGWTEGVQLMVEGEKRRFWIPGKLAYGDTPTQPGAPSGTLVFDVELIKIG
ncbi:FKBP-type peptidyl-prolyl cis-trans isomerase [Akkermansiaceae bacterium]|nr:FKBP-type peptidyl-prolyl cis-trans isomerase [Akkermansiaceae bacterium]MDB4318504.1 FKBP-type peptidyl-prolyl cis-trans isomerase [bacterium]MDA8875799.1 FKBP-type peptidyl-prolyl cis-trans isomerase [Akkermansiaceae bacterium]MDB4258116.1 FKBP-type peptidyl-prolyl cis-trans isomerase [Akkermansiaceae bacterium]MDB4312773.1 FKBP-type peptidyl-prolyl cis-trans isomerase [Akkermansiaceae bacterium]